MVGDSDSEQCINGWTVLTLKMYIEQLMAAHELLDMQRHQAADKAITKAENSTEKRLEAMNEFRSQLADVLSATLPRREYDVQHGALVDRIITVEKAIVEANALIQGNAISVEDHRRTLTSSRQGLAVLIAAFSAVVAVGSMLALAFKR